MNILFFTEISPFPVHGGERIRSYGLLKALSLLGYKVTACIQNQNQINIEEYKINNIEFVEFKNTKLTFWDNLFSTIFFVKDKEVIQIFNKILKEKKIDIVMLDFYLAGRYINFFKKRKLPVIVGTHNSESNLILQKPTKNVCQYFRKIQHYIFMSMHEHIFYKNADALITVSEEDTDFHSKFYPRKKIYMIPNFLDENLYKEDFNREDYFIMTANFGAYMNYEGLKWFVLNVWNDELDNNNKLYLVGKKSLETLKEIKKLKDYTNIIAIGSVDDITPYISKAKAVFIPLLHGSGSRLKCLEAMALKTPIIGTSKGIEGIKTNSVIISNNEEEFRSQIKKYKYDPEIGDQLYKDFIANYSLNANIHKVKYMMDNFKKRIND